MRTSALAKGVGLILSLVAVACGGKDDDGPRTAGPGSGGSPASGGAATGGSAEGGTGGSAAGGTGGGAAGGEASGGGAGAEAETRGGLVQFGTMYHYPDPGMMRSFANALFWDFSAADNPGAGDITITADPAGFAITLADQGTGDYGTAEVTGTLSGGEQVTVSAAGSEIPAFTTVVTYPLLLLLTAPSPADGESVVTVSRSADVVLEWDRGEPGVELLVQTEPAEGGTSYATLAPSEAGTLTLSRSELTTLASGTELTLYTARTTTLEAGGFPIDVTAIGAVMTADRTRRVSLVVE